MLKETNTPTRPRIEPGSPDPESDALTIRPVRPPVLFVFGCVLIVAMATMCFNLQSVLLLSHIIKDVLFKNDDERYPYQSLKFAKN